MLAKLDQFFIDLLIKQGYDNGILIDVILIEFFLHFISEDCIILYTYTKINMYVQ